MCAYSKRAWQKASEMTRTQRDWRVPRAAASIGWHKCHLGRRALERLGPPQTGEEVQQCGLMVQQQRV